jgi:zinc transport system ATP-binding protein
MQGPSIEFADVGLVLGTTRILEGVSFNVRAGSIHCIVGPNGGGKTSLVRSLVGQMPHSGRITVQWQQDRGIGYVPQAIEFDPSLPLTVADFLALTGQRRPAFLGLSRSRRPAVEAELRRVGLHDKMRSRLGSLSGGERQRVLFAQAMLPPPALLILDEPTSALDVAGKRILEVAIREFASSGGTVVWINHDLAQVQQIADAVTCIDRKVVLQGAPREVIAEGVARGLFPGLVPAAALGAA